eukprot:7203273-Prymnesium_polylepis.1
MPLAGGPPVHSSTRPHESCDDTGRERRLTAQARRKQAPDPTPDGRDSTKDGGSTKDVLAKVQPTGLARDAFEGRERAV